MEANTRLRRYYVTACLVIGVILDADATIRLAIGFSRSLGAPGGADASGAYGAATALMAGWTALLAWAIHRPRQRRMTLLLTILPVVAVIWGSSLASFLVYGPDPQFSDRWLDLIGAPFLAAAFAIAYRVAGSLPDPGAARS